MRQLRGETGPMVERGRCRRCNAVLASDQTDTLCSPCSTGTVSNGAAPVPPARFWERADVRAAIENRHVGQLFRAYRKAHDPPIPQTTLADWLQLTQGHLSIIERRRRPETDLERLQRWCDTIHVPLRLRWFRGPTSLTAASELHVAVTTSGQAGVDPDLTVALPAGRFFSGSSIAAVRYPAVHDEGRVVVRVPTDLRENLVITRPGRGLVVGATDSPTGPRSFGLDSRAARSRLTMAVGGAPMLIPDAYELDDLTLGVLWATSNLDDALLDDDSALHHASTHLRAYEKDPRSTGGPDLGSDMSALSRMWLGSDFCARHILRHAEALQDVPTFWTREQRGEESSTWLLFAHKHDYLKQTADTFEASGIKPTRTFCVPRSTVSDSGRPERILLLLAVALMESFGIKVEVCAEPEYSATHGFALDQRRRAIVADWVRGEGIWHVDVTDHRARLREFADASGYARAHSVIAGPTPARRLRALADYLELDWTWLRRRCAELGDYGTAGLARPRSRLLSTVGIDQACRFVGAVSPDRVDQ